MSFKRLHVFFFVVLLLSATLAVTSLSAPNPASKKKPKPTAKGSKETRTTAQSKSKKPGKQETTQAANSKQKPLSKTVANIKQSASDSRSSGRNTEQASSRKGKKGFSVAATVVDEPKPRTATAQVSPATASSPPDVRVQPAKTESQPNTRSSSEAPPQPVPVVPVAPVAGSTSDQPDRINVIEYKDAPRGAGTSPPASPPSRVYGISNRRTEVDIDTPRIIQIQKALKDKGFYTLEPTGIYDDDTINAMKAFQLSEKIDVTGYPTAHALKRLGL